MEELLLCTLFTADKLDVIDQQNICLPVFLPEKELEENG